MARANLFTAILGAGIVAAAVAATAAGAQTAAPQTVLGFSRQKVLVYDYSGSEPRRLGVLPATDFPVQGLPIQQKTPDGFVVLDVQGRKLGFDPSDLRMNRAAAGPSAPIAPQDPNARNYSSQGLGR